MHPIFLPIAEIKRVVVKVRGGIVAHVTKANYQPVIKARKKPKKVKEIVTTIEGIFSPIAPYIVNV